jgi:ABC-type thiamine transport system substrate-binding protein
MKRRDYRPTVGVGVSGVAAAGCVSVENTGGGGTDTTESSGTTDTAAGTTTGTTREPRWPLRVVTYDSFFGDDGIAGRWLKEAWERDHDTRVEFTVPSSGVNQFVEFMLADEAQQNIAVNNVQFPATTTATLPEEYAQYAYEPAEPVTFTYDELAGNVGEWTEAWTRQVAAN